MDFNTADSPNSRTENPRYNLRSLCDGQMQSLSHSTTTTTNTLTSTAHSNSYQNQLHQLKLESPGNSNNRTSYQGYSSISVGKLGLTLTQVNTTTNNVIDADFSDHFVVRRTPENEKQGHNYIEELEESGHSNTNSNNNHASVFPHAYDVDDRQYYSSSSFISAEDHEVSLQTKDPTLASAAQNVTGVAATAKKVWTPFQFGKRPKTSGISPVLDGKRSHNATSNLGNRIISDAPPNPINSSNASASRPLYMHDTFLLDRDSRIQFPGRAHPLPFNDIDERFIDSVSLDPRNHHAKETDTATVNSNSTANSNKTVTQSCLSVLRPFTAGEVLTPSILETMASPSIRERDCYGQNDNNFCKIDCDNPSKYNNELQEHKSAKSTKLQSKELVGQIQSNRLPCGFYSKQYQIAIKKNTAENSHQSQHSYSNLNKPNSTTFTNNAQTQIPTPTQRISSRQNSQTQIPSLLQSKPNVYRNAKYSSTYSPTRTVPEADYSSIHESSQDSSIFTSACNNHQSDYFLAKNTSSVNSKVTSKKPSDVAAKGDAPSNSAFLNLSGVGSLSVAEEIPESMVTSTTSNPTTTSCLSYVRPKTVCENQVSYNQMLSVDCMVKYPNTRGSVSMSMGPYVQQRKQNLRDKTVSILPYHDNVMSSSAVNASVSALSTRTGSHHPQSQRLVLSKTFRNDLTSPLGPFHIPIRSFILVGQVVQNETEVCDYHCDENHRVELNNNYNYNINNPLLLLSDPNNNNSFNFPTNNSNCNLNSLRHSIFHTCSQKNPIPIHLIFDYLVNTRKVGEGVYGEVFKAYFRGLPDQRVYKVVPIEGSKVVNGEKQKKFGEVEPEIIICQELNKLRDGHNGCYTDGHCRMLYTRICQGKYPAALIEQWKTWHRAYVSQNDLPEFEVKQLYTIFEFEYHGTDIESFKFRNAKQSLAVLVHVIHALAAAEAAVEFEHRDLHWGNILVVKTREPFTTYTVQGINFRVPNCGLKSTIIDYTISRLTNSTTNQVIYTDLANDEDQFCGSEDYQFEIYRMMRDENKNDWSKFCPKTNIFWAHYLVGKLIDKGRYNDTTSSTHSLFKNKLLRIQSNLLKFQSCAECIRRFLPPFCRELETTDN